MSHTVTLNHYHCPFCGYEWSDVWDCAVDDDCGQCGKRHISPYKSESAATDNTHIVVRYEDGFVTTSLYDWEIRGDSDVLYPFRSLPNFTEVFENRVYSFSV